MDCSENKLLYKDSILSMGWIFRSHVSQNEKKVQINAILEKSEKQTDENVSSKQSKGYKV